MMPSNILNIPMIFREVVINKGKIDKFANKILQF